MSHTSKDTISLRPPQSRMKIILYQCDVNIRYDYLLKIIIAKQVKAKTTSMLIVLLKQMRDGRHLEELMLVRKVTVSQRKKILGHTAQNHICSTTHPDTG